MKTKIHGKYYDLTNFKHPGGDEAIELTNGIDCTVMFESHHPFVPKDKLADIQNIVASKSLLLKQAIQPVENIVHDFSVEILRGLESVFIVDSGKEIARQREELSKDCYRNIRKHKI